MSLIGNSNGKTYAPGLFLAHEECVRETKEIPQSLATTEGETKYVKMGTPYPSNDGNIEGLVYEDVDVTAGNAPGSVVTGKAVILSSILPVGLTSTAKAKLENLDFIIKKMSSVTRPY